jgi:putative transposase
VSTVPGIGCVPSVSITCGLDFQFDVTDDGRAVKLLYVVDEFTREALAMEAERRIDADKVVDVLDRIVRDRGRHPEFVRCDNGPEMTSNAPRDWCRFKRTGAAFIVPGSPWENPFVGSFNSRVRDELLAVEVFSCLAEAKVMIEETIARTTTAAARTARTA